ncbi:hypothetical protein GALMADRAFT_427835 [Galerina marginata CBS 339.88]|uniref:Uncharacterized protein n=1 Tax=Galerina marginata (strain CBS 339.88) TaxID=685588 RepID=A0A067T1L9_GALM3|nr:hypothetical protein GALMADRAFT_427835 [Galerina marginata CBS 339.88]
MKMSALGFLISIDNYILTATVPVLLILTLACTLTLPCHSPLPYLYLTFALILCVIKFFGFHRHAILCLLFSTYPIIFYSTSPISHILPIPSDSDSPAPSPTP